jgi:hypothetical protein
LGRGVQKISHRCWILSICRRIEFANPHATPIVAPLTANPWSARAGTPSSGCETPVLDARYCGGLTCSPPVLTG